MTPHAEPVHWRQPPCAHGLLKRKRRSGARRPSLVATLDELPIDGRPAFREGHTTVREHDAQQDGALVAARARAQDAHGYPRSTTSSTGTSTPGFCRSLNVRSQMPRHSGWNVMAPRWGSPRLGQIQFRELAHDGALDRSRDAGPPAYRLSLAVSSIFTTKSLM